MEAFREIIMVGRLDGSAFETVEALVGTGANETSIPRPILDRLGVVPTTRRRVRVAGSKVAEFEAAPVLLSVKGETVVTMCIFGDPDSVPVVGALALQGCDPPQILRADSLSWRRGYLQEIPGEGRNPRKRLWSRTAPFLRTVS